MAEKVSGSGDADRTVWYAYSGDGTLAGFMYNNADYYYQKNLQGDIIGIYNAAGELVVTYEYDAWGNLTDMTDSSGNNLGEINPFRYRSYYYDEDTGWYYLQSRYYDAEVGRFLNADDVHYLGDEGLGCNLFTYCENTPVNGMDSDGHKRSYTISRSVIAGIIDFIVMCIPILRVAFAPIKMAAKVSGSYLAGSLRKYLPNILQKVLANGKKIVLNFAIRIAKVPFIGKLLSNQIVTIQNPLFIQR